MQVENISVGEKLIEGKTKIVYDIPSEPGHCLVVSKDRITAGDGARANDMVGKAEISTTTMVKVFAFLTEAGIPNHFVRPNSAVSFVARQCHMIPIEFVTRRVATGSFLRRFPGVPEGHLFAPPKLEYFFKDDANHDPQWSYEQLVCAGLKMGEKRGVLGVRDVDVLSKMTATVFEILERAWKAQECQLVDMKIEFGVDVSSGDLILADSIDSDSWRLWPQGDKRLMLDKQVYRNLDQITSEALETVRQNFQLTAKRLDHFSAPTLARAVILLGSERDEPFGAKIRAGCEALGFGADIRVTSAHKAPAQTMGILGAYEALPHPVVVIAVAGRSNGLGPVSAGNCSLPVINCPPVEGTWAAEDVWSSLRMPSGLGCVTVLSPEGAAQAAAHIFALHDHRIWARLRARQCLLYMGLQKSDETLLLKKA